jgi:CubicO group peptidase (beta-lactamase class C family)
MKRSRRPLRKGKAGSLLLAGFLSFSWALRNITPAIAQPERLVDFKRLDAYIAAARADWEVPGIAVGIVKNGELVFSKGYGVRDINDGGRVDEQTLFAIGSNTKAFTSAALAMLVDDKALSWDDPVVKHLPYFQSYNPYVTGEMRVRDLLSHRSGLGTFSGDLLWYGTSYSAEEVVRRTRFLKPAGPFRAHFGYSNVMFIAAGEIVPAVTGKSWSAFVQERIFNVLAMDRTVTSVKALERLSNVATPHAQREGNLRAYPWRASEAMAAAGGIISSVADLAKWITVQLNRGARGEKRILSQGAFMEMWAPHMFNPAIRVVEVLYPSTHFLAYGLGWNVMDYRGRKVVSHSGGADGMFSRLALVPEENLGMVILTNSTTGIEMALMYQILDTYLDGPEQDWSKISLQREIDGKRQFAERMEAIEKSRNPAAPPSLPLDAYTGTYGGPLYGDGKVTVDADSLVLQLLPAPELIGDLRHLHDDTFVIEWRNRFPWFGKGTVHFLLNGAREVKEMKIDVPNNDFWFHELEFVRR